ncbi:MAG: isoprenylcysteine carboxylmethyltransferase family protein [Betaproteobacteria bacterium]|nr:isoprenylcysteine carboxylmethyltransferase family protein [Betaproteobacteria bacterium]
MSALLARLAGKRILAWRLVGLGLVTGIVFGESRWEGGLFATACFFAGLALAGTATVGRLWCALYISGNKNTRLTTEGPYALCRHPLYLFNMLGLVGVALSAEGLSFAILIAATFAVLYPAVMAQEEQLLGARFGAEYQAYAARVPRFWPRLQPRQEPERWEVSPHAYFRNMLDSIWFVLLVGLVEVFEALHELGALPVLWNYW